MKNKKILNITIYIMLIVIITLIMYFSYTLFINNQNYDKKEESINGDNALTYTAIFVKNGADFISSDELTCQVINDKCEIKLPSIIKKDGYVLGWNIKNVNYAKYSENETITINDNQIFYAITYKENTLTIYNSELDYLSNEKVSCKVYNKEEKCSVIIPSYNKIGYENRGYSTRNDSLTGIIFPNMSYTLKKDVILYPIYNVSARKQVIDVSKVIQKYGLMIEIEKGCSSNVYNNYLDYLNKINQKAKYLLIPSKITFLNNDTFNKIWGREYAGMNYGPKSLRLFDVKCPNIIVNDYYYTMVHELAHSFDFYYSNYFSQTISSENDIINLYTKYKKLSNRPFREYSYSNIREFFADCIRYYYFKYLDPLDSYSKLDYPSDIKKIIEKYICIAKNDYNKDKC